MALELIIGHLHKLDGYHVVIRQKVKSDSGEKAEIDIKASKDHEVICCECKGYGPGKLAEKTEIQDWIDNTLPRIKNWLAQNHSVPDAKKFEFYVSTDYTPEAREYANSIVDTHKRQPISFLGGKEILEKLRTMKQGSLVEIFREQFL